MADYIDFNLTREENERLFDFSNMLLEGNEPEIPETASVPLKEMMKIMVQLHGLVVDVPDKESCERMKKRLMERIEKIKCEEAQSK